MYIAMTQRKGAAQGGSPVYYSAYYCQEVFDRLDIPVILIDNKNLIPLALEKCDALVIPGGADVVPKYYGEEDEPLTSYIDDFNDELDWALVEAFYKAGKPILGICRGHQFINVFFGGTLYQNIEGHSNNNEPSHYINVNKDSFVYDCYKQEKLFVNSLHHQAVKRVAEGFSVDAVSEDGIVEAMHKDNVYTVQWHPERIFDLDFFRYMLKLFAK